MGYENNEKRMESVYSKRIKAGKRRTYFFDVRETKGNDFYLTITESRKRFDSDGYDRHKIFLYKEDFNKFMKGLSEAVDFVKTDLMPDFDFDAFNHDEQENHENNYTPTMGEEVPSIAAEPDEPVATSQAAATETSAINNTPSTSDHSSIEVDKW